MADINAHIEGLYYQIAEELESACGEILETYPDSYTRLTVMLKLMSATIGHFAQMMPALTEEQTKHLVSQTFALLREPAPNTNVVASNDSN